MSFRRRTLAISLAVIVCIGFAPPATGSGPREGIAEIVEQINYLDLDAPPLPLNRRPFGTRVAGLRLGASTFADARALFGDAIIHRLGPESGVGQFMCYRTDDHGGLVLAVMGQSLLSRDIVDGLVVLKGSLVPRSESVCAQTRSLIRPKLGEIEIGMTPTDFIGQLRGMSSRREADLVIAMYRDDKPSQQHSSRDSRAFKGSGVSARFRDGRLIAFRLWNGFVFD